MQASLISHLARRSTPPVLSRLAPAAAPSNRRAVTSTPGRPSIVQSLLHGSPEAKRQETATLQHGRLVGRNKYVHELIRHHIIPSKRAEYIEAARKHYSSLRIDDEKLGSELVGSWETLVGDLDTFVHIVRHPSLSTLTPTLLAFQGQALPHLPFVQSRSTALLQEFKFMPAHDNPALGGPEGQGIFELRTYSLVPGAMLEWEAAWRKGIEARRRFVNPAGAWFTQVGPLHTVHHLWQYPDLEQRKLTREKAWEVSGWSETVRDTVKLAKRMTSQILVPCEWSPMK